MNRDQTGEKEEKKFAAQYDAQLLKAISETALLYYEINVSKDRVVGGVVQNFADGASVDVLKELGLGDDCALSAFVTTWRSHVEPEFFSAYDAFFNVRQLTESFYNGNTEVSLTYRTTNIRYEEIWAKQTMLLFRDDATGDVMAFCYAKDVSLQMQKSDENREDLPVGVLQQNENDALDAHCDARPLRALAETALVHFSANLTKDEMIGDVVQEFLDGVRVDILRMLGLGDGCAFSAFIAAWRPYVSEESLMQYDDFFDRARLMENCLSGRRELSLIYQTMDARSRPLWAKQTMLLSQMGESGDVVVFSYAHDVTLEMQRRERA